MKYSLVVVCVLAIGSLAKAADHKGQVKPKAANKVQVLPIFFASAPRHLVERYWVLNTESGRISVCRMPNSGNVWQCVQAAQLGVPQTSPPTTLTGLVMVRVIEENNTSDSLNKVLVYQPEGGLSWFCSQTGGTASAVTCTNYIGPPPTGAFP